MSSDVPGRVRARAPIGFEQVYRCERDQYRLCFVNNSPLVRKFMCRLVFNFI